MTDLNKISEILPEGLTEEAVEQIFGLVDNTINEQVEKQIRMLEAKVNAYLRTKVDQLKDQALMELSEENEMYRNARLFESVRSLMAFELNDQDEDNALSDVSKQHAELQEEFELLTGQLEEVLNENQNLENTVRALSGKVSITEGKVAELEGDKAQLLSEVENLEASLEEGFTSSEKAVVVSKADLEVAEPRTPKTDNEFITEEALKYMPFSQR